MSQRYLPVRVQEVRSLTSKINEYVLVHAHGQLLPLAEAGSHIRLHTGETGLVIRHYSILGGSLRETDGRRAYRIAVQKEEAGRGGSRYIHEHFNVGRTLLISRPKNNFALVRGRQHSVLIAGGIGITPIFSMVRSLWQRKKSFELLYIGRDAEQMAYLAELKEHLSEHLRWHFSTPESSAYFDFQSFLAPHRFSTSLIYVCGPQPMLQAVKEAAHHLGLDPNRIRTEIFGVALTGQEVGFEVQLQRTKKNVWVPKDASILDVLEANGVAVLWDCRRGECGLCVQELSQKQPDLVHYDSYLSVEEKAERNQLCICVSRTNGQTLVLDL